MKNDLTQSLLKVIGDTYVNYKGTLVRVLIGGFEWNNQKYKSIQELDDAIHKSQIALSNSIKKDLDD